MNREKRKLTSFRHCHCNRFKYLITIFTLNMRTPKISTNPFQYLLMCLKSSGCVANIVDPDQMLHSVASGLGLHCLLKPVSPNNFGK